MTKIQVGEDGITVSGHTGYSDVGQDIVCSAISTLTQNLIMSIEDLTEDTITYSISPGRVDINYKDLSDKSKLLVDSFFVGVCSLSRTYPLRITII